ncbi:cytochrome P450 [Mycena crocata]|nr:cytochrome P450 [Mycena crocata]
MQLTINYSTVFATFVVMLTLYLVLRGRKIGIRNIPGPPSPSWIFGHMLQLFLPPRYGDHEFDWQKSYGSVYRVNGCFGQDRLMVADPLALQYILNSPHFYRAPPLDTLATLLFGRQSVMAAKGTCFELMLSAGDEHRRLRAALNVGFTAAAVRSYQTVFRAAAEMLSDEFERISAESTNISPLRSRATLAAISEVILGQSIEDLGADFVANNIQIVELSATQSDIGILADTIGGKFPLWVWRAATYLPTPAFRSIRRETLLAARLGRRIVRDKMDAAKQGLDTDADLFGVLRTSAVNPDTSESTEKLSEDDVASQTTLILVAGQETTANTIGFALLELAKRPDLQEKLRVEIHSSLSAGAGHTVYDNMPLLNAIIKVGIAYRDTHGIRLCMGLQETLRLYPAGPLSDHIALQDEIIPLGEDIVTPSGVHIKQIPVSTYNEIVKPGCRHAGEKTPMNSTPRAGLKPLRIREMPSCPVLDTYGIGSLSFLGGPRTCLGILEMQVFLSELVGKFTFTESEGECIRPRFINNLLPIASSGKKALPLCVARVV